MSEYRQQPPHHPGEGYDKPDPTPPPCPDPCDEKPPWGPPEIRPECCPKRACCPDDENECCTWEEIDDPCIRATSPECGVEWTKIECKCVSSNKDCNCEVWDCCCDGPCGCVPCRPCEGLIPDPKDPGGGGCYDPGRDECTADDLQKQLDALNQCITSQKCAMAKLDADIKIRGDRAKALGELIEALPGLLTAYDTKKRNALICREDCLKGFFRNTVTIFNRYPPAYLAELKKFINGELCKHEMTRCCQKNLEGKLTKVSRLIAKQDEAAKNLKNADTALEKIKGYPGWVGEQFENLEKIKEEIEGFLSDPQSHKKAFYLFYWKFVPKLCRCFPWPFCCDNKEGGQYQNTEDRSDHLGCKSGDWHPSAITIDRFRSLICCAWDYAREQKEKAQEIDGLVADVNANLTAIQDKVKKDADTLDDRIKNGLEKVGKPVPTSR